MSSDVSGRKSKSNAWKYFRIKDKKLKQAYCKICKSVLSYRTSVTNLIRHIKTKHNECLIYDDTYDKSENGEVPYFSLSETDDDSEDSKAVKALQALENKHEEEAVCLLCHETFPDQSTDELMKHMLNVHNISQIKLVDSNSLLLEQVEDKPVQVTYKPKSAVWSFFDYVDDEKTVCACVHCKKEFHVVGGLDNMKKHLLDEHPEALLHHKSDGDPLFLPTSPETNMEGSDEENLHVEYLDSDDENIQEKNDVKPSDERRSYDDRRSNFDRRPSFTLSSPSEPSPKKPSISRSSVAKAKVPDSLEHFTNYVTSLLQELPEKVSKRLQMDFVKQIIEAKIACDEVS